MKKFKESFHDNFNLIREIIETEWFYFLKEFKKLNRKEKTKAILFLIACIPIFPIVLGHAAYRWFNKLQKTKDNLEKVDLISKGNYTKDEISIILRCTCPKQGYLLECPVVFHPFETEGKPPLYKKFCWKQPFWMWTTGYVFITLMVTAWLSSLFITLFYGGTYNKDLPVWLMLLISSAFGGGVGNTVANFIIDKRLHRYKELR